MKLFSLKEAQKEEAKFNNEKDYKGLADVNISICENLASDVVFKNRLPKIGFYLGRAKELEKFKSFLETNEGNLQLFLFQNREIWKLTLDCFRFGFEYESLTEQTKAEIRNYFSNHKYSEMFAEIMPDYSDYISGVEPFDFSSREVKNEEFSEDLISEIGPLLVDSDGTMFYDKNTNEIVELDDYDDAIKGVQFPLDYSAVTNRRLDYVIKLVVKSLYIEQDYENELSRQILGQDISTANMFAFNDYYLEEMVKALQRHISTAGMIEVDIFEKILNIVAVDYLEFINLKSK